MITHVKICGLTRSEDIEAAILAGADYLGFIVEAASARRLTRTRATELATPIMGRAKIVAVTVNADDGLLTHICSYMRPDFIQCHGDESPERVAEIASRYKVGTIKAVGISDANDLKQAETYAGVADIILYDAKPPKDESVRGGHGLAFDHRLIQSAPTPKIWALAGGLTAENIAAAITATHAPIVDVSSGVESEPGVKDKAKIRAFMRAVDNV